MNNLSLRERRMVAIALLVAALALVWLAIISPILGGLEARSAERASLIDTYKRNQRLLDAIPVWRAQAERQKRTAAAFAISAPSQIQGQEALKQRLTTVILASGAAAPTVQDLQSDLPPGWIGARADALLTPAQLNASLRRLQSEEPYVVVEYLSVNADQAFRTGHAGPLEVRLELSAPFRLADTRQP